MKQKIVIKIQMMGRSKGFLLGCILAKCGKGEGFQTKVLKKVAETNGVISVGLERDEKDKVVVIGDGVDSTKLIMCLRKKVGHANIESLEEVKDKENEKQEEAAKVEYNSPPIAWTSSYYYHPQYPLYICH